MPVNAVAENVFGYLGLFFHFFTFWTSNATRVQGHCAGLSSWYHKYGRAGKPRTRTVYPNGWCKLSSLLPAASLNNIQLDNAPTGSYGHSLPPSLGCM